MSEHDYWQVESSVYGGVGYAPATLEEYAAIAKALDDEAAGFAAIATAWESAALQLQSHRHSAPMCVTLQSGDPSAVVPGHVTAPYAALGNRCYDHATACQRLSDDLRGAADLLIRAHSLYSQAEMTARRMFTELLQAGTQAKPGYAAVGVAAVAAGGFLAGWTIDGKPNSAWMSTFTYPFQEGVLSGAGGIIGGVPIGKSIAHTDEVNKAAGKIANFSGPAKDVVQGNHLDVREVQANADAVRASGSVAESMENLRRLAEERLGKIELNSGLEYGTIAIQRYERSDGTNSWLVTIPGTDGQPDSPLFGPGAERGTDERRSGAPQESGGQRSHGCRGDASGRHRQGRARGADRPFPGGLGASLPPRLPRIGREEYTIEHVVTAGSPVANHPIPQRTWVTSVEIDDELVAALDGAANPVTDNWLTVQGHVSPAPAATPSTVHSDG